MSSLLSGSSKTSWLLGRDVAGDNLHRARGALHGPSSLLRPGRPNRMGDLKRAPPRPPHGRLESLTLQRPLLHAKTKETRLTTLAAFVVVAPPQTIAPSVITTLLPGQALCPTSVPGTSSPVIQHKRPTLPELHFVHPFLVASAFIVIPLLVEARTRESPLHPPINGLGLAHDWSHGFHRHIKPRTRHIPETLCLPSPPPYPRLCYPRIPRAATKLDLDHPLETRWPSEETVATQVQSTTVLPILQLLHLTRPSLSPRRP